MYTFSGDRQQGPDAASKTPRSTRTLSAAREQKAFLVPNLDSLDFLSLGPERVRSKYSTVRDNLNTLLPLQRDRERGVHCDPSSSQSLTLDGKQRLVDLAGQQRLGQLPEELLEDGRHVVHADLVSQNHVPAAIKVFPELKQD